MFNLDQQQDTGETKVSQVRVIRDCDVLKRNKASTNFKLRLTKILTFFLDILLQLISTNDNVIIRVKFLALFLFVVYFNQQDLWPSTVGIYSGDLLWGSTLWINGWVP